MEKIKLVIWDLDDTFWKGTLSEGGIVSIPENINIVKELTGRGIMNSIVSKNDFEKTKNKLVELGVWDYFIFPHIAWMPKGQQIQSLINKCQLRPVNVLFLDDNSINIEEAKFYNPELQTASPDFISQLLIHPSFEGKEDLAHSRLKDYKLLELKDNERNNYSDNYEFLKDSGIQLIYNKNVKDLSERVHELIERTNQLNYTKRRISRQEVEALVNNDNFKQAVITVKDKFGDYGIVGYYCLDKSKERLIHFIFSCRILNLGIEQKVYAELNFPDIEIVGDVVSEINKTDNPVWIKTSYTDNSKKSEKERKKFKLYFKGGCDLSQSLHYLPKNDFDIFEDVNWVTKDNFPIHAEHSQFIVDSLKIEKDKVEYLSKRLPFVEEKVYSNKIFLEQYNVLIYSVLMDYSNELYRHRTYEITVPFGGYYDFLTDRTKSVHIQEKFKKRGINSINEEFLEFFQNEFEHIGQISKEKFVENLNTIRNRVHSDIPIIFINGAEVPCDNLNEVNAERRHAEMNAALDNFISASHNTFLVDVRKLVTNKRDLTDNIRHYSREKYKEIAEELLRVMKINRIYRPAFNPKQQMRFLFNRLFRNRFIKRLKFN